jgi:AIPR protein
MAKNDVILVDGIIDQRVADELPSSQRDEVFEFLVLEEKLKDYDLSRDEIEAGWTDGSGDGGIDGFYTLVNGHLLDDAENFVWPRTDASIDVWLFICKHQSTFSQAPLDAILATIQELFDLSKDANELQGTYSDELLELRELFSTAYRRLSIGRPKITFRIIYASRGDTSQIGESVAGRAHQIEKTVTGLFSSCSVFFEFVGASELVNSHRKSKRFSLALPFLEHLATGKDSYVLLVRLEDYWKFVSDENGQLRRYLFDSNVRDYLGSNPVNEDIGRSLADEDAPDFWWLNNGVTILATNATIPGKTIQLQDIQIVNGLQTTETVFRHFQSGAHESRDRALLVKILVSSDAQARDRIIRATNNQTLVEVAALHATDKVQRDIEEILERHNWYYERRKNYYRNIGKSPARFVTPIYLASAVIALVFKDPARSRRLKPRFMRNQQSYEAVFSSRFPIEVWPVLVNVFKQVDAGLASVLSEKRRERFISNWRGLVAFILTARHLGTFDYSIDQLVHLDPASTAQDEVREVWKVVRHVIKGDDYTIKIRPSLSRTCCEEAARQYSIAGTGKLDHLDISAASPIDLKPMPPDFVELVNTELPEQPWKPGIHHEIASKLGRRSSEVNKAIQQLIAQHKRYPQKDGIVYDFDGKVLIDNQTPEQEKRSIFSKIFG